MVIVVIGACSVLGDTCRRQQLLWCGLQMLLALWALMDLALNSMTDSRSSMLATSDIVSHLPIRPFWHYFVYGAWSTFKQINRQQHQQFTKVLLEPQNWSHLAFSRPAWPLSHGPQCHVSDRSSHRNGEWRELWSPSRHPTRRRALQVFTLLSTTFMYFDLISAFRPRLPAQFPNFTIAAISSFCHINHTYYLLLALKTEWKRPTCLVSHSKLK